MRDFFISLAIIAMFGFIIFNFYVDVMNYRNSYTLKDGGVFVEGMKNFVDHQNKDTSEDPIIIQEQHQEEQRKLLGDDNMSTSQPEIENDYASVENPHDFSIFNKNIMKKVLASKHLIPGDINLAEESQKNYIRIGKSFIEEVSIIRNFSVPDIEETDYETLGRFVVKLKSNNLSQSQEKVYTKKILTDVKSMLSTSSLTTSSVRGENNPIQSTTKRITGMFQDNGNAMLKKKLTLAGVPLDDDKFTDTYKPDDDKGKSKTKVKPYNSAWSIF
tara:strand:+ start:14380 stop:15198 length:819 start_codon:yes stop_codon:yes gene_type:complete